MTYKINFITVHQDYIDGNFQHDVGLLQTRKSFYYSDSIQPIPLASELIPLDSEITVCGWGYTDDTEEYPIDLKWNIFYKDEPDSCGFAVGFTEGLICLSHPEDEGICIGKFIDVYNLWSATHKQHIPHCR